MSFFINLNYSHTLCPNGCKLFNDNKIILTGKKEVTSDEKDILIYINKKKFLNNKILHVGVGSSYLAKNLNKNFLIEGISISNNEIQNANIKKRKLYLLFSK